ncbi:MAG: efflux RND transporter periplasmic adaptor subunit [Elusimicrobia bacterium]|nr:efflux RND transporter periplasmic adaptor subunit [Elusimicrobiota bacterium]
MRIGRSLAIAVIATAFLAANLRLARSRRIWRGGVETARREAVSFQIRAAGILVAQNLQVVRAPVNGQIIKKKVNESDPVKKGQLLLQFDDLEPRKNLQKARSELQTAQKDRTKAVKEVRIQQRLFSIGAVSKKYVDDAVDARDRAQLNLENARKNLSDAQNAMKNIRVLSPLDGFVIQDKLGSNQFVSQGMELLSVGTFDKFEAKVGVDEIDIAKVRVDQSAQLRLDAFPERVLFGRVTAIAPQAERTGFAKVNVFIEMLNDRRVALKPNLSVTARIVTGKVPNALTVPVRSVFHQDGRNWVRSINRWGRSVRREVSLGGSDEDRVVVLSGVAEGEAVLLSN